MSRTPRVDTVRNQLAATIRLLELVAHQVDDLHTLAYDRHTARGDIAVNGGATDWALDTHGDPRARDAYRHLAAALVHVSTHLAEHTHLALRVLADGDGHRPRTPRTIRAVELAEAIDAQARRAQRGDYTPHRLEPQPAIADTLRTLRQDLARLKEPWLHIDTVRTLAARLDTSESEARELLRWLTHTTAAADTTGRKRKKGRKK